MKFQFRLFTLLVLFVCISFNAAFSYETPRRKIEIKPYLNMFFSDNLWEEGENPNIIKNETSLGFGLKIRSQIKGSFGFVTNASYIKFTALNNTVGDGLNFTAGPYYSRSFGFGRLTLDGGFGVIIAAEDVFGLLLPSLEYAYPVSNRLLLSLEVGWPVPNDWVKKFEFKEHYSSFNITIGTNWLF